MLVSVIVFLIASVSAAEEEVLANLSSWYLDDSSYGADTQITQLSHALECALVAKLYGYEDERVIAGALLHDIGWKLSGVAGGSVDVVPPSDSLAAAMGIMRMIPTTNSAEEQRARHDVVGAAYLKKAGFPEVVARMAEGHVQAKRYLTHKDVGYYDQLSAGSKRTLAFQGGPMTKEEALQFEEDPLFKLMLQTRKWDEAAKQPGLVSILPDWESYLPLLRRVLTTKEETQVFIKAEPSALALRAPGVTKLIEQWYQEGYIKLSRQQWLPEKYQWSDIPTAIAHLELSTRENPATTFERVADSVVTSRTERFADDPTLDPALRSLLVDGAHHPVVPQDDAAHCSKDSNSEASPLVQLVKVLNLGQPVSLFKEKVNYKFPGAAGYRPHQDYYANLDVPQSDQSKGDRGFLTFVCMIAVDPTNFENGCAEIAPETWKRHRYDWIGYGETQQDENGTICASHDGDCIGLTSGPHWNDWNWMAPFEPVIADSGDILIYDNHMPHRSGNNTTPNSRRALFGVYYDPEQVNGRDLRSEYYKRELSPGGRRHARSAGNGGKANLFHLGSGVTES